MTCCCGLELSTSKVSNLSILDFAINITWSPQPESSVANPLRMQIYYNHWNVRRSSCCLCRLAATVMELQPRMDVQECTWMCFYEDQQRLSQRTKISCIPGPGVLPTLVSHFYCRCSITLFVVQAAQTSSCNEFLPPSSTSRGGCPRVLLQWLLET